MGVGAAGHLGARGKGKRMRAKEPEAVSTATMNAIYNAVEFLLTKHIYRAMPQNSRNQ